MLATFAFDVCHEVYRAAREVIDGKIATLNLESSGKYVWHPDRVPRLGEYVADFARAGERALGKRVQGRGQNRIRKGTACRAPTTAHAVLSQYPSQRGEVPLTTLSQHACHSEAGCAVASNSCGRPAEESLRWLSRDDSGSRREILRCAQNDTASLWAGSSSSASARNDNGLGRPSRLVMFRMFYLGGAEYHAARRHLGISEFTWADWSEEIRTRVGHELVRAGMFPPSKYFRQSGAPELRPDERNELLATGTE